MSYFTYIYGKQYTEYVKVLILPRFFYYISRFYVNYRQFNLTL